MVCRATDLANSFADGGSFLKIPFMSSSPTLQKERMCHLIHQKKRIAF